jgi:hypothetical protein
LEGEPEPRLVLVGDGRINRGRGSRKVGIWLVVCFDEVTPGVVVIVGGWMALEVLDILSVENFWSTPFVPVTSLFKIAENGLIFRW